MFKTSKLFLEAIVIFLLHAWTNFAYTVDWSQTVAKGCKNKFCIWWNAMFMLWYLVKTHQKPHKNALKIWKKSLLPTKLDKKGVNYLWRKTINFFSLSPKSFYLRERGFNPWRRVFHTFYLREKGFNPWRQAFPGFTLRMNVCIEMVRRSNPDRNKRYFLFAIGCQKWREVVCMEKRWE